MAMDFEDLPSLDGQLDLFNDYLLPQSFDDGEYNLFNDDNAGVYSNSDMDWSHDAVVGIGPKTPLVSSPEFLYTGWPIDTCTANYQQQVEPELSLPGSPEIYTDINCYISVPDTPVTPTGFAVPFLNVLSVLATDTNEQTTVQFDKTLASQQAISGFQTAACVVEPVSYGVGTQEQPFTANCDSILSELDSMVGDVIIDQNELADIGPYLPPISSDDVLSLLSREAPVVTHSIGVAHTVFSPILGATLDSPAGGSPESYFSGVGSPQSAVSVPSSPRAPTEKRQRKKEQNKTAAQRYREKKKSEQGTVLSEYEVLELRNTQLRSKVDEMTKEINYLKGLIEEICA